MTKRVAHMFQIFPRIDRLAAFDCQEVRLLQFVVFGRRPNFRARILSRTETQTTIGVLFAVDVDADFDQLNKFALEWMAAMCSHIPNRGEQIVQQCEFFNTIKDYSTTGNLQCFCLVRSKDL